MSTMTILIPDEATLIEAAEQAAAGHLMVLTNGARTVLSPVWIEGWARVAIKIKTPTRAALVPAGGPAA